MIYGYLGSGKTSYAKKLELETGAIRFSPDEWMTQLFGDDPEESTFAERSSKVEALMENLWVQVLAKGIDIVLDTGFWSRSSRDRAREKIESLRAIPRLYFIKTSEDTMWKRCESRNQNLNGSLYIARNTFEVLKTRFEPLGKDESFILIEG